MTEMTEYLFIFTVGKENVHKQEFTVNFKVLCGFVSNT